MPTPTVCPSCGTRLTAVGSTCPECGANATTATGHKSGEIDEPPRRARVVASAPPVRPRPVADDETDRPRPGKPKPGKVKKSGGALKPLLIGVGVVALLGLVGICGGGVLLFGETILHPAPSGWTSATCRLATCRVTITRSSQRCWRRARRSNAGSFRPRWRRSRGK